VSRITQYPSAVRKIKKVIAQLAFRTPISSEAPIVELNWHPVRSNSTQNIPYSAVEPPIGIQDTSHMTKDWRSVHQDSKNVLSIHKAPFQISNWNLARSKIPVNENLFYEAKLTH
jgi:hypothetical protein